MAAETTKYTTRDGLGIYDLDVLSAQLWAVAGPDGYDPAQIDTDALPEGFRWISDHEWEDACNRVRGEAVPDA